MTMSDPAGDGIDMAGLLTRTVVQSPVIRWILHARIRRKDYNDVVYVGDDFIHVKQVKQHGHLEHIATKNDFDARIRAAKPFSYETVSDDVDFLLKAEDDESDTPANPPQCIVLTTDANDLLFIHLTRTATSGWNFVQQSCPMPSFDRTLFQPGEHLAIDPYSRALAVAANEKEVILYSAKQKERIQREMQRADQNWCPVSAQRPLQVDGVIQHLDFLYPPLTDSGSRNEDQVILLLIMVNQRRVRAEYIEWHLGSDLHHAVHHVGHPLDNTTSVPNLLIPLLNASFLLITGDKMTKWNDLLCGSAVPHPIYDSSAMPPSYPGASPGWPMWANWCRPVRGSDARDDTDYLYLIREDGRVYLFQIYTSDADISHAGDFDCHVGSAFASMGSSRDPDILAVAGDMSNGCIQSIGSWFTPLRLSERSRYDTMDMELIETVPNWASVTDMVTTTLPGKTQRPRDGIFVTSSRQPHGAITELRHGLEARLSAYFELAGLRSVTGLWALPLAASGHVLLLLSNPTGTKLLEASADAAMEDVAELDEAEVALDSTHMTLAATVTLDARLVQITTHSICISGGPPVNFEDSGRLECEAGRTITAAAVEASPPLAVATDRSDHDRDEPHRIVAYRLDTSRSGAEQIQRASVFTLTGEPLAVALIQAEQRCISVVATAVGRLTIFVIDDAGSMGELHWLPLPSDSSEPSICDSLVILRSTQSNTTAEHTALLVCGLRNGSVYTFMLDLQTARVVGEDKVINFSRTTVKLTQPGNDHSLAYATSGLDMCLLTWDGKDSSTLQIQSVWISDKLRPELAQGAVVACTHMPAVHLLSAPDLAGSLIMISGDEFLVTTLEDRSNTVPRQIPVSGTPNRLIYAEQQRCLVCASVKYESRAFASNMPHAKPEERRQIFPVIDFVPSRSSEPSYTHEMQPGERIHALLEWSFKQSEDKRYSFILVGGSYIRSSGSVRGRITFLQPVNKSWEVIGAKEGKNLSFDAPVTAMALLDDLTLIICTGRSVVAYRFSEQETKWQQLCLPVQITSPGVYITVSDAVAYISTNADSLIRADLQPWTRTSGQDPRNEYDSQLRLITMGPRADKLLSHLILSPAIQRSDDDSLAAETTALMTTKYGEVIGLRYDARKRINAGELLFEAQLPRSLTRIHRCKTRPSWKPGPPEGVLEAGILGCAADGSLVGVAILDRKLWRRLSWLQRLREWSEEISPHSWQAPAYTVSEGSYARDERALPAGLSTEGRMTDVGMRTSESKLLDGHIDGDILGRLLVGGPEQARARLRRVMNEVAARDDRPGEWLRAHLDAELDAVDAVVELLQRLMELWI